MYKLVNTETNETIETSYDLSDVAYKSITICGDVLYGSIEQLKERLVKNTRTRNGRKQQLAMIDYTYAIVKS